MNPIFLPSQLWRHRGLTTRLIEREVQQRYRGSVLGLLWTMVHPLLSLAVYTFVFTVIFQPRTATGTITRTEYVVRLFCGIVVYGLFAETAARAPGLIVSKPNFVKQVVFPLEILPVVSLGTALVSFGAGVLIVLIAAGVLLHSFSTTLWLLPVVLLPLLALALGMGWFLASLGVFLRDTQHVVRAAVQLLFFLTPIVWTVDLIGEHWRPLVNLNPLAVVVGASREVLIYGHYPHWGQWGMAMGVSLAILMAGYAWFAKTRKGFADVL